MEKSESVTGSADSSSPAAHNHHDECKRQLSEAINDRDRLFNILERRSLEIERLESELSTSKQQLAASIESKCAALAKHEESQQRALEVTFKERRLEQERALMQTQLAMVSADLERNQQELQQLRRESSARIVTLEAKLHEKSEELSLATLSLHQQRESSEILTLRVKELQQQLTSANEEFATAMKKYQAELTAKERLVELHRGKSEDSVSQQREITDTVAELKSALREATEEFGALESRAKAAELQHQIDVEALNSVVEELKAELRHVNHLLSALKRENVEIAVEKVCPSARSSSRHSLSAVYAMYADASEDFEQLTAEHEQLKQQFAQVVEEIKERAPTIQRTQLELARLRDEHAEVVALCETLKRDRHEAQRRISGLLDEVSRAGARIKRLQREKGDLSHQVCSLLTRENDSTEAIDAVAEKFCSFKSIEELQQSNMQLVNVVRELSAAVEELESKPPTQPQQPQQQEEKEEKKSPPPAQNLTPLAPPPSTHLREQIAEQKQTIESLSQQLSEVQSTNFKLRAQLESAESQLKLQQRNAESGKRKMQTLEERGKSHMSTIAKLETSLIHVREQLQETTMRLARAESALSAVTRENKSLLRSEAEQRAAHEAHQKQAQTSAHVMASLEHIRASVERIESGASATKLKEKCEELERQLRDVEAQAGAEIEQYESESQLMQEEIARLRAEVASLREKMRRVVESDEESEESDEEFLRLRENFNHLRSVKSECAELKLKNEELEKALAKEESMRTLLSKARGMITKLSEEKEQLKEELEKSKLSSTQDFLTCELDVSFAGDEIVKTSTKKRARDETEARENDEDDDEVVFVEEKRVKIEQKAEEAGVGCMYPLFE